MNVERQWLEKNKAISFRCVSNFNLFNNPVTVVEAYEKPLDMK